MSKLNISDVSQLNDQATTVASAALSESVVAASLCTKLGFAAAMFEGRPFAKFQAKANRPLFGRAKTAADGLPDHFLLAVTETRDHALEFKTKRGKLVAGKELKVWDRAGLVPRPAQSRAIPPSYGDVQGVTLQIALDPAQMPQRQRNLVARTGQSRRALTLVFGKDPTSQSMVDLLIADGEAEGPAPVTTAAGAAGMGAFQGSAVSASGGEGARVEQLQKLASLHASGALTDAEFATEKAKVLGR
jgi:hypothetical protein